MSWLEGLPTFMATSIVRFRSPAQILTFSLTHARGLPGVWRQVPPLWGSLSPNTRSDTRMLNKKAPWGRWLEGQKYQQEQRGRGRRERE